MLRLNSPVNKPFKIISADNRDRIGEDDVSVNTVSEADPPVVAATRLVVVASAAEAAPRRGGESGFKLRL